MNVSLLSKHVVFTLLLLLNHLQIHFAVAQLRVPQLDRNQRRRSLLTLNDDEKKNRHLSQQSRQGDNEREENANQSLENSSLSHVALAVPLYFHSGSYHIYVSVGSSDPPQHKLLIVDTGSHLAAFPCLPCYDCGTDHASGTNLFDPNKSSTFHYVKCGACVWDGQSQCAAATSNTSGTDTSSAARTPFPPEGVCEYQQKYTEGSTWTAYEARDVIFVGTKSIDETRDLHQHMAVPFVFGCEVTETGLFRDQYADGILGMAMHPNSLLEAFVYHNRIANLAFGMCIDGNSIYQSYYAPQSNVSVHDDNYGRKNKKNKKQRDASYGGILTIGGADEDDLKQFVHHLQPMQFADLQYDSGWYTVHIKGVYLVSSDGKNVIPVVQQAQSAMTQNPFNLGKGTIVDSGTTDTFFPATLAKKIRSAWEQAATHPSLRRIKYSNDPIKLTSKEFRQLPTFHLILQGDAFHSNEDVHWMIPPASYMEQSKGTKQGVGTRGGGGGGDDITSTSTFLTTEQQRLEWKGLRTFTNRIYLDEKTGAVLGANAMMDHHVLFDNGNHRLGIAPASCAAYDDVYHDVTKSDKL